MSDVVELSRKQLGGIDVLINVAELMIYKLIAEMHGAE